MKPDDRDLDRDLVALSAGMLSGIALAAATLGHGLELVVGIERDGDLPLWRVVISGYAGLESDVRLSDPDMRTLVIALDRAVTTNAARAWKIGRNPVVLVDLGETAVGVGVAGGTPWAVVTVASEVLRFPASDLARVRDALAAAVARVGRAGVVPQPASGSVQ